MASQQMTAPILAALIGHPEGVTAKDMAKALHWKDTKASQLMGVLHFQGILDRRNAGTGIDRRNNQYVYTVKPEAVATPAKAPPRWVSSPRIDATERLPRWAREMAIVADRLAEREVV